jgi:hypothetical protein
MSAKRPGEPLNVFYSIKLTQTQRIQLIKLGGPEWIRNQIERSTELPGLGENDAGQIRSGRLPKATSPAGGT